MSRWNRSKVCRTGCLLGLTLGLASAVAADEPIRVPTTAAGYGDDKAAGSILDEDFGVVVQDDQLKLTIEQAIALTLRRNLFIGVQRYQRSQAVARIEQNQGIYDINLSGIASASEDTSPTTSALQATGGAALVQENQRVNMQVRKLTASGGTAQIDFNNLRSKSSNLNDTLNPSFGVGLDLTFTQPLARGFGREVTERNLIVARTDASVSRRDFRTQVENILQLASDTYWNLVESLDQLDVAEESLRLAEDLHRMNQIQVEVGTKAPLEVVTSEARVAARRQDIIRFRAQVENDADDVRRFINLDRAFWSAELVPTTEPEIQHLPIDVDQAVQVALENRADIQILRLQNQNRELDARVARNLKRPLLDLSVTYGANAAEGDAFTFVTDPVTGERMRVPVASTGYFDALETISMATFDGWRLGLTFGYPIGNRTARAQSAVADLALRQGYQQLEDLELGILTFVRQAARNVETAAEQIASAKVSSNLQRRNLEAEEKRYENGLATSFQVLEVQEDLSEARSAEVSAVISYRRALVAFYLSTGQLLDEFGVVLSDDAEAD